jgi:hypothetical protein
VRLQARFSGKETSAATHQDKPLHRRYCHSSAQVGSAFGSATTHLSYTGLLRKCMALATSNV